MKSAMNCINESINDRNCDWRSLLKKEFVRLKSYLVTFKNALAVFETNEKKLKDHLIKK